MTVRAIWNDVVLAESDDTVVVEGNQYFPPASVHREYFVDSASHTHCRWKGDASYYILRIDGTTNEDAAWYYPAPYEAAEPIRDYVAFWKGVQVTADPGDGRPGPIPPPR